MGIGDWSQGEDVHSQILESEPSPSPLLALLTPAVERPKAIAAIRDSKGKVTGVGDIQPVSIVPNVAAVQRVIDYPYSMKDAKGDIRRYRVEGMVNGPIIYLPGVKVFEPQRKTDNLTINHQSVRMGRKMAIPSTTGIVDVVYNSEEGTIPFRSDVLRSLDPSSDVVLDCIDKGRMGELYSLL